jgi:hypothetical protein
MLPRWSKFSADTLLNNLLLYLLLSLYIATVYTAIFLAALVAGFMQLEGAVDMFRPPWWLNIVVITAVALTLWPVRRWLQVRTRALIYGQHDDPYALISKINRHLQSMISPQTTLPTVAETIGLSLKLPYVAIETHSAGTPLHIAFGWSIWTSRWVNCSSRPAGQTSHCQVWTWNCCVMCRSRWELPCTPYNLQQNCKPHASGW